MTGEEYSAKNCKHNKDDLNGDNLHYDPTINCVLHRHPNADSKGYSYEPCDFRGEDCRECRRSVEAENEKKLLERKI